MSNLQREDESDEEEEEYDRRVGDKKTGKKSRDRVNGSDDEGYGDEYDNDEAEDDEWDVGNGNQKEADVGPGMLFDGYGTNRNLLPGEEGDGDPPRTDREQFDALATDRKLIAKTDTKLIVLQAAEKERYSSTKGSSGNYRPD